MNESRLETGYSWDTGLVRQINEDSVLCTRFDLKTHSGMIAGGLFAVADGMGGHDAGEIASDLAIKSLVARCLPDLMAENPEPPLSILSAAFNEANSAILAHAEKNELQGMGTTLTAALVIGPDLYVAHIGDSRCYVINKLDTIQVTKDHSVVQELIDAGLITDEQAWKHPQKNEITRVLGHDQDVVPDCHHIKLYSGDNILICSDGLCGVLPLDRIVEIVLGSSTPDQACAALTDGANLAGGPDNISTVIVKPGNLPSLQAVIESQTSVRKL